MSKKRILYITQEMGPYTALGEISSMLKKLPVHTQEKGFELRLLMPKFGTINERRHRLHEVVRLSGMNIIVDDDDYPLIIKVASFPGARMQVYFLDNEEFFSRKQIFVNKKEQSFKDNIDRMVFFCKGAIETVKKFGWAPDIVSCHGWFTSLVPFYLKQVYANEPIFEQSKIIYSAYADELKEGIDKRFLEIAAINKLSEEDMSAFLHDDEINLQRAAILHSDAVVKGSPELPNTLIKAMKDKDILEYSEGTNALANYLAFFKSFIQ